MIDNFVAQPYPLECTADGVTWSLVIGWREIGDRLTPVIATPDGLVADGTAMRYRTARPVMALSAHSTSASMRQTS